MQSFLLGWTIAYFFLAGKGEVLANSGKKGKNPPSSSLFTGDSMNDKHSLRNSLRALRLTLASGEEGAARSRRMQERLLASDLWRKCRRVAAYVSVKGEAGTGLILEEALRSGRDLFLPRCRVKGEEGWPGVMDFFACSDLGALEKSSFGIPEPVSGPEAHQLMPEALKEPDTLVIVPALAFDRSGYRLGYGGGYYDRMLASATCPCVGLAFHDLLVESLPREEWDRPVSAICTEEVLLCL